MNKRPFYRDPDRVIAPGTVAAKGRSGDANALWRYEKERRRNLLAEPGPHSVALVLDGLRADFNVPKIFRSAETLGAHSIHLVNIGPFDPAPAKGAFRQVPAHFHEDFASCCEALLADDFTLVALDPYAEQLASETTLPQRCAFVLGNEAQGLSDAVRDAVRDADRVQFMRLPQWGRTESLNVAVAASLALYEYTRQHGSEVPQPVTRQQRQ